MIVAALAEALIGTVVERGVSAVLKGRGTAHPSVHTNKKEAAAALRDHLQFVEAWSSEIQFKDLLRSKRLVESFVDLECQLGQIEKGATLDQAPPKFISGLLNTQGHVVILGRPGAGKTTSMQRLALSALQQYSNTSTTTPIVLRLRDLYGNDSIIRSLATITGFTLTRDSADQDGEDAELQEPVVPLGVLRRVLTAYLNGINALVFLDGLDECSPHLRVQAEREINDLMEHAKNYRIVLTCRSADYAFSFPARCYMLLPLTSQQARTFCVKWLGAKKANVFEAQLEASPIKGAEVIPITIAHLCAIFERRGEIPRQPRFVYQKLVRLLLEEWDEQRGVKRSSRYASFDVDRKLEFLRRIAFELTIAGRHGSFTHVELELVYLRSYEQFGLPREEYSRVAREIESHSGLIVQSAYNAYEFAHKSIQEFLTAEYLLRLPSIPRSHVFKLADELAISTGLSSRPELYIESVTELLLRFPVTESRARLTGVLLGRLIVENPDFPKESRLGWVLLTLLAVAYPDWSTRESPGAGVLSMLMNNEVIRQPIESAVKESYPNFARSDQVWIMPPTSAHLPEAVSTFIVSRTGPGLPFLSDVFRSIYGVVED